MKTNQLEKTDIQNFVDVTPEGVFRGCILKIIVSVEDDSELHMAAEVEDSVIQRIQHTRQVLVQRLYGQIREDARKAFVMTKGMLGRQDLTAQDIDKFEKAFGALLYAGDHLV